MVFMMIFGAILEACSVSMVIPVVGVVIDESSVTKYEAVGDVYEALHMQSITQFALLMMTALILIFVIKNIYLYQSIQNFGADDEELSAEGL